MFIKTTFNSDLNHILNCVNKCDFGTKCFAKVEHFVLRLILAASIRNTLHILQCAEVGADVVTCPLSAIKGLLNHPLTDIGLEKFLADYKKVNG